MATVQVIGPDEMVSRWQQALPDIVVEVFNDELAKQFNGKTASVREKSLLTAIAEKGLTLRTISEQRWLKQTAELYKARGWKVVERDCGGDDNYDIYYNFALT